MISHFETTQRLHRESSFWRKQKPLTDFIRGIIRGLQIAIIIVKETKKDHDIIVSEEWKHRRSTSLNKAEEKL